MSCSATSRGPLAKRRPQREAALLDHLEAEILQHRHALAERDRLVEAVNGGPDAVLRLAGHAIEVDADRLGRQPFDPRDVLDRARDAECLDVDRRKRRPECREKGAAARGLLRRSDSIGEPLVPRAQERGDIMLERLLVGQHGRACQRGR